MKRAAIVFVVCVSLVLILVGAGLLAVTRRGLDPGYLGPRPLPPEVAERYVYPWPPLSESLVAVRATRRWNRYRGVLQTPERAVDFEYWRPIGVSSAPAITVIPILEGGYELSRDLCEYFAARGYAAVMVYRPARWMDASRPLEEMELLLRRGISDQRLVLRWLRSRPEVDPGRTYTLGISLGAILGCMLTAVEPSLQGSVLAMAGGDIPGIIGTSIERPVVRFREAELRQTGLSLGAWQAKAREAFVSDPLLLAPYVDARKVIFVLTRFDHHVPERYQEALVKALGGPAMLILPTGHYTAVAYWFYLRPVFLRFFSGLSSAKPG